MLTDTDTVDKNKDNSYEISNPCVVSHKTFLRIYSVNSSHVLG